MTQTCWKWQKSISFAESTLWVQEVIGVENIGGLPLIFVKQHRWKHSGNSVALEKAYSFRYTQVCMYTESHNKLVGRSPWVWSIHPVSCLWQPFLEILLGLHLQTFGSREWRRRCTACRLCRPWRADGTVRSLCRSPPALSLSGAAQSRAHPDYSQVYGNLLLKRHQPCTDGWFSMNTKPQRKVTAAVSVPASIRSRMQICRVSTLKPACGSGFICHTQTAFCNTSWCLQTELGSPLFSAYLSNLLQIVMSDFKFVRLWHNATHGKD